MSSHYENKGVLIIPDPGGELLALPLFSPLSGPSSAQVFVGFSFAPSINGQQEEL